MANEGTLWWPMARAMATRPNAEAIVDGETRLTYAQWGRRVRGLGAGLRSLGLRTGDVVASVGQNSFRHLECWVGIPAAGMVLNDLNYRLAVPELEFIINDCGARAIVADAAYLGGGPPAEAAMPLSRIPGLLRDKVGSRRVGALGRFVLGKAPR